MLGKVRQEHVYQAIDELHEEGTASIWQLCEIAGISRSAYYKWLKRVPPEDEVFNGAIAEAIKAIHEECPDKGYRRIRDDLERDYGFHVSDNRVLRICRYLHIKSTIKYRNEGCTISDKNPQHIAENILNRDFHADKPNEKWLTDVTEFKYYVGTEKRKVYLSAILDLYDRRIVAYVIGDSNSNPLVYETFEQAVAMNPDAHPIFHSDRGYQYTNNVFHQKLLDHGMVQSMSRVGKCIDNGPMEGFWGILKRERYYKRRFSSREEIVDMITNYINYYNNRRYQRRLGVLTPMEKHIQFLLSA
ncbi:MAG: IS3 family transposase [Erysipelotrichaceae bacterium]|nr:IS3 family transposase [Erysipelotrichaceae bacterium]